MAIKIAAGTLKNYRNWKGKKHVENAHHSESMPLSTWSPSYHQLHQCPFLQLFSHRCTPIFFHPPRWTRIAIIWSTIFDPYTVTKSLEAIFVFRKNPPLAYIPNYSRGYNKRENEKKSPFYFQSTWLALERDLSLFHLFFFLTFRRDWEGREEKLLSWKIWFLGEGLY